MIVLTFQCSLSGQYLYSLWLFYPAVCHIEAHLLILAIHLVVTVHLQEKKSTAMIVLIADLGHDKRGPDHQPEEVVKT